MIEKKQAFILAFLLTLLFWFNYTFVFHNNEREKVRITKVIDGDTLETDNFKIRLANINTPEKDERGYELAKEFVKRFENESVEIEILGIDRYKRVLARIYVPFYLNLELVRQGLARKFLVQESELEEFARAELDAIMNERGIWEKSPYFGCFRISVEPDEELVEIENLCEFYINDSLVIRDESRKKFKLGPIGNRKVRVHSGNGSSNSTDIFLGAKSNIWNNERDSVYVFDSDGKIAAYYAYNYGV